MPTFVWVFGGSASGKETLIKVLLNDSTGKLRNYFEWKDKSVISIPESLAFIGQHSGDPVTLKRSLIVEKAKQYCDDESLIVLIKGQDVDLNSGLVNRLREEIPGAGHEIIYLSSGLATLYKRVMKKKWWNTRTDKPGITEYERRLKDQINKLSKLNGFKITAIDSTSHDYRPASFPPKLNLLSY